MFTLFSKNDLSNYLKKKYSFIYKKLSLIAITGSSGKTSTGLIMYKLFNLIGIKTSFISKYYYINDTKVKILNYNIKELYKILFNSYTNNVKFVIVEIDIKDIDIYKDIKFKYTIFTNTDRQIMNKYGITNYINDIKKIFKNKTKSIINMDDSYSINFVKRNTITYGFLDADYKIKKYILYNNKTIFQYKNDDNYIIETSLIGKCHIYNLLPSIIILDDIEIGKHLYINKIKQISVENVYEVIKYGNNKIILDQAKTLNEIVSIINTCKLFEKKINVILEFNDLNKQAINYLLRNTNYSFICGDKINYEDLEHIKYNNYEILIDRKEAIKKGINYLKKDEVLLMIINNSIYKTIEENKKEVTREYRKQIESIS